jgi:4-amino-4-deoxy-L-arabinose transferase-like glycosyltransferase
MSDGRNRAQSGFADHERRYVLIRKITLVVMVFLVLSTFVAVELARVNRHSNSMKGDWGFYLQLGLDIRQRLALTDTSRHPLYPALLSLFAEREFDYFTKAKLLSVAIGTLGLGVVYILSRRMYSDNVAFLTMFLLSVGDQYRRLTSSVMPDAFLALLFFVAWYFTVRGFSERRNWIWGGVFAGLAYLAKATGEIFVLSWICTALVVYRTRLVLLRDKKLISHFLLFLAAFLIVASPLLVYNYKVYHNPFYNINSKHLMWLEDVEGQYVLRDGDFPTVSIYLKTHTMSEIMEREWTGFKTMWGVLLEALIPARTWPLYHFLRSYGGLICIVVAFAVLIFCREGSVRCFRENPGKVVLTAVLVGALWLSFAWYAPFTTGARYLLPLSPILYLLIAVLIWKAGREVLARFRLSDKARTAGYVAFNACLFCWMLSISAPDWKDLWRNPFQLDR